MLEPMPDGRWSAVCSGCLHSGGIVTLEELEAQFWERRPDGQL